MNFHYFGKNWGNLSSFHVFFFCAGVSKTSNSIKTVYIEPNSGSITTQLCRMLAVYLKFYCKEQNNMYLKYLKKYK